MKFLTVIFLVYCIVKVFKQKGWLHNSFIKFYELLPMDLKDSDVAEYLKDNDNKELNVQILKILGWFILDIILIIIQFSYVIRATSYSCNKAITLGYLVFWMLMILRITMSVIKTKNKNKRNTVAESLVKLKKYRISKLLTALLSLAYFGYMFFILFIL